MFCSRAYCSFQLREHVLIAHRHSLWGDVGIAALNVEPGNHFFHAFWPVERVPHLHGAASGRECGLGPSLFCRKAPTATRKAVRSSVLRSSALWIGKIAITANMPMMNAMISSVSQGNSHMRTSRRFPNGHKLTAHE